MIQDDLGRCEADFATALRGRALRCPDGVLDVADETPRRRFDVYKNNVVGSLTNALSIRYPALRRLVGDRFFRAMCADFVLANLPVSPVLIAYGHEIPEFIESFEPAAGLPYLADVARLESAHWQAYHAADVEPAAPRAFAAVQAESAHLVRLALVPSVSIVISRWPIVSIWETNMRDADVTPLALDRPECALVARRSLEVGVMRLTLATARFIEAIRNGAPLGAAVELVLEWDPSFDPSEALSFLTTAGIVMEIGNASGLRPRGDHADLRKAGSGGDYGE
jgi:hypothetical protein